MSLLILDANVILSGLLALHALAPSARILEALLGRSIRVVISYRLLAEYSDVLSRPEVMKRHRRTPAQINRLLTDISYVALLVEPAMGNLVAPDPGDQHLWDVLAAEPEAILVTGDRKLLESADFPGRILSPRQCVERFSL